jgi:L-seryl-tRNA(Ser) seleniumtransferase
VDELVRVEAVARLPRPAALAAAREALAQAREEIGAGLDPGELTSRVLAVAARNAEPRLRRAINATGVVLHTNLGRAPLAGAALARVAEVGRGYSNLEYDLDSGSRGSRHDHLAALGEPGELIEIGDGFRIPDVLARSGARLVEVGTTNRTRATDYEGAVCPETAALLRVHQSNFRTVGFSERPSVRELAAVARRHRVPLLEDMGSGSLVPFEDEPLVTESLAAGADLVSFSGDKLLGGPQAGIVVGGAELVAKLRRHPLQRALRPDKLTLAALEGTLLLYLEPARALAEVPALRSLHEAAGDVRRRAERLAALVGGEVVETAGRAGGGALPLLELPGAAVAVELELATALRHAEPPVVALVRDGRTLLDCRTIDDAELDEVAAAVRACR